MRVARLVARRIDPARETVTTLAKRRFDRHAFVGGLHVAIGAALTHDLGSRDASHEFARIGIELENAALEMVVANRGLRAQRLEAVARIEREMQTLDRVAPRTGRQAFEEKR